MADIIGTRDQVDEYIGSRLVVAAYQGSRKYYDAYSDVTGNLPLYFNSRVNHNLNNYRLYGTSEGSGVETINLLDLNAKDTANGYVANAYLSTDGAENPTSGGYAISEYIPVSPSTQYSYCGRKVSGISLCFYNASKEYVSGVGYTYARPRHFTSPSDAVYLRMTILDPLLKRDMLLNGYYDEEPAYEPYGYQIPLTLTSGQNTNTYSLYIGSTKLGAEEYLDYAEQKIYKMNGDVLTPTDPPAPLPAITAYEGENTLSSTETVGSVTVTGRISATYKQLEYLEATGTQYIETDIVPTYSDAVETELQFGTVRNSSGKQGVFGTIYDNRRFAVVMGSTSADPYPIYYYYGYPWQSAETDISFSVTQASLNQKQKFVLSPNLIQLGSDSKTPIAVSQSAPQKTFIIFGIWDNDGIAYPFAGYDYMRCYGMIFKVSDTITHNLIPVERNSDGAIGMLDTITNKFYTNAGTGTFVKGGYV